MPPAVSELCTDPGKEVLDPKAAVKEEEVAHPQVHVAFGLPAPPNAEPAIKMAHDIFLKGVKGEYQDQAKAWADEHHIPWSTFSAVLFTIMLMVFEGVAPALRDFTIANLKVGMELLYGDMEWAERRSEELHGKHGFVASRSWSIIIYERFVGLAEFGFDHHLWGKPFWALPDIQVSHPPIPQPR